MSEWQDISTAPKDGTMMLVYYPPAGGFTERVHVAKWKSRGISLAGGSNRPLMTQPTHWMPLPAAPRRSE